MENASKALLIAAGVFLGIMLLTVMIYVFRQGAKVNESYDQKQISLQLELYNSQFEKFDRDNNNVMDVISLCNLAFDVNKECDFDKALAVQVEVDIGNRTFMIPNSGVIKERNKLFTDNNKTVPLYNLVDCYIAGGSETLSVGNGTIKDCKIEKTDKLSMTKLIKTDTGATKTIYKYLFKVASTDDFQYNPQNNKVIKIKLTAYYNPDWNK